MTLLTMVRRFLVSLAREERGDIESWLPRLMAIVVAVAVLVVILIFAKNNIAGWLTQIWDSIIGNL
jgi:ABC-type uncharacterized transport system permease subunit